MWRRLHFHWDRPIGEGGRQGFVNEKAASWRWWIDDDVWKGCVWYVCVHMQLELWFIRLCFMLSWLQDAVEASDLSTTGVSAPHQKGCRWEKAAPLARSLRWRAWQRIDPPNIWQFGVGQQNSRLFSHPRRPHPSLLSSMQMAEPSRCRAVRSFRVTDQYFLIRAALPWEAGS